MADLQIGMQSALKQDSGAAELQHFINLPVDLFEGQNIAILGAERAVKCAEGAILGAEICVIDVAVDLIRHDARIIFPKAQLVRGHSDAYEVIGFEHLQSFLFRQSHKHSFSTFASILADAFRNIDPYDLAVTAFMSTHSIGFAFEISPSLVACW